ncbi:MAG: hypothetical protein CMJ78_10535 [Planctomycetaceae bacterium]|nr:hypothetical protein [Planctomycetaceae bacterium]
MRSIRVSHVTAVLLLATTSLAMAQDNVDKAAKPSAEQIKFFDSKIKPILAANCYKCHGGEAEIKGGLRLTTRDGLLKGGDSGLVISRKNVGESILLDAINYRDLEMPPRGKLRPADIELLTQWVKMGLPWNPADKPPVPVAEKHEPRVTDEAKQFWSFRKIQRPEVPKPKNSKWTKHAIDAFIAASLDQAGLEPSGPTDKVALIRRAHYSLVGIPPTPDQVAAFLKDDSPNAFEKVVDELLASKHYGEQWARHWMDLVRYAESNSYERDGTKPNIWRYRDYLIRSFNDDKPFDQFTREQLAGDELDKITNDTIIATGYYRLGIWQDEPVDRVQELYEDLDDIVMTTGQVFLGLTINCARCHDHKLDPIPQKDYYRFMAFFHGIDRHVFTQRPIAPPELLKAQQDQIAAHRKKVDENNKKMRDIENLVINDFQEVEKQEFRHEQHKVPLLKKRVPDKLSKEKFKEYLALKKQQKEFRRFRPMALDQALTVREIGRNARETFVLMRGSAHARGEKVEPGFMSVLDFPDPTIPKLPQQIPSSGRRRVLADWVVNRDNPLTARVLANRIWQFHFGRGIVRSANNFGFKGTPPTHPELLDWLASELVDGGWKLKRLHKLIMMSNAYQMSSRGNAAGLEKDPENNLFWRFNMRRLTAEELRDTVLAVNGSLNSKMFGPSIYPVIPQEVKHGQSRPGAGWGNSSPEERARRSVYIHVKRSLVVPMMAAFDAADTDATCPVRFETTQPTQALGMLNGEFANAQAKVFGDYLRKQAAGDVKAQVKLALHRATQRTPTDEEVQRGTDLVERLMNKHKVTPDRALDFYCLLALNLNEMIYLD